MGIFDNAVSVIIGNKIVDSITTSDNGVIYQRSEHTRLSIDVPLNLTYSDAFNITGHLTTANGTGISGEQVLLKVGNTVMDSTTTGNNGEYSFTQTPVSSGTHSFQVVYAGSNTYGDSESSTVTRDVNKETTVLTATPDKQKYDIGDTVVLTVGFTDDEGNNINNVTELIRLRINYDGVWRTIPNILETQSSRKIRIEYQEGYNSTWELRHEETNNYAYSHINIPLNIVTLTLISASATNQVITSGDSTTVTATLLDQDGDAIPNRSLSYTVKHGSTVLDTGSATTDSNGQISVSYTGTAVGQVDFEFSYGNFLIETYEVYDCSFIDCGVTNCKNTNWNKGSALSVSTDSTGTTLSASSSTINNGRYIETVDLTGDFIIEWKMKASYGIRCGVSNATANMTNSTYFMTNSEYSEYRDWKIECVNGVLTAYIYHNNQWEQLTWSSNGADPTNSLYFAFSISSSGTTYTGQYKDLRIYPI